MKKSAILGLVLLLAVGTLFGYLHINKSSNIDIMTLFADSNESEWLTVNSTLREFLAADYAQQHFLCRMLAELDFIHEGIDNAEKHKIIERRDITVFLEYMLVYGKGFDRDKKNQWAKKVFRIKNLPGEEKIRRLLKKKP